MSDIYADLLAQGYKPEENADKGFEPVTGKYVCRIDSCGRVQGVSQATNNPYDFYALNTQVVEVVDGNKATNRFLKKNYNNDSEGIKKLVNDLFTAGIALSAKSQDELDAELATLTDKTMNIRAWARKKQRKEGDVWVDDESGEMRQYTAVVKSFGKAKADTASGNVPF